MTSQKSCSLVQGVGCVCVCVCSQKGYVIMLIVKSSVCWHILVNSLINIIFNCGLLMYILWLYSRFMEEINESSLTFCNNRRGIVLFHTF